MEECPAMCELSHNINVYIVDLNAFIYKTVCTAF